MDEEMQSGIVHLLCEDKSEVEPAKLWGQYIKRDPAMIVDTKIIAKYINEKTGDINQGEY